MRSLLPLFLALLAGCAGTPPDFTPVLHEHINRYPAMEAADAYKLCHQAAMGGAHLGADTAMVHAYLRRELDGVEASDAEPLVESLSPDGAVVRVNLRPFKARGGDEAALFDAMMRSWDAHTPAPDHLRRCLDDARPLVPAAALDTLARAMAAEGYPAVHHSDAYAERYHPAYRVVLRTTLDGVVR